ncbi:hypothetical protein [uncultured Dubosiella sp.]|uniref:hypothetical protein n=1 Tax=uncultured Dubosiella sp. TaxID=1937011 RepID=UPI00272EBBF4|nr:hypothetical protein [uncultured Dubosiella sp.]
MKTDGYSREFPSQSSLLCEKGGSFALGKGKTGGLTAILTENEERKKRQLLGSKQKKRDRYRLNPLFSRRDPDGKTDGLFLFFNPETISYHYIQPLYKSHIFIKDMDYITRFKRDRVL